MGRLRGNPWAILCVLSLAYFMAQLDISVLTVAVPDITRDLHTSFDRVAWALGSYVLALAVTLITAGRLGDLYGRRRVFRAGVVLFTLSSLAAGLTTTVDQLIAARALQGLGAALLIPQTMALLVEAFPVARRGTALGVRGTVGAAAAVVGPLVSGLLVTVLDWRWVFFVNVPVGTALLLATVLVPDDDRAPGPARLDVVGTLLVSVSLFCFAFAVSQGERYGWRGWFWGLVALSAVAFAVFLRQQRRRQSGDPLVPFELFRDRDYALMNVVSVCVSLAFMGLVLVLSVFFQSVLAFSALKAGLAIVPAALCSMVFGTVAGRLSDRLPAKYLLLAGTGLTVAGMLWTAAGMHEGADWPRFVAPLSVIGVGNAFLFTPLAAVGLRGLRPELAGAASGVLVTTLQIGSMIGTALSGALLGGGAGSGPTAASSRSAMVLFAVVAALAAPACAASSRTPRAGGTGDRAPDEDAGRAAAGRSPCREPRPSGPGRGQGGVPR
ncbi:DHA2 family efflux MFS transporter permease subunit [Streptomyces sp. NPDC049910]|uniref:DHA2 family efflux MFS transporter permease subunit n=1 Tax=Streptomyces sp. NPDC049910 TaxID=3155278 RepID=UPI0034392E29